MRVLFNREEVPSSISILIFCVGESLQSLEGRYSSADFDAAVRTVLSSGIKPYTGRKQDPAGRSVLIGEGRPALETAEQLLIPCPYSIDPLLNEIPLRSCTETDKRYSADTWQRKAAAQRKHGNPRQPESREAVIERAEAVIQLLKDRDSLLITYPLFLSELLDRLRIHNYVIQRTGLMRIQPLERFIVSRKDEHCGGCQHNCFLSNPGCGIGRDKAMRLSRKKKNTMLDENYEKLS